MNRRSPRAPWRPDSGFYVAYACHERRADGHAGERPARHAGRVPVRRANGAHDRPGIVVLATADRRDHLGPPRPFGAAAERDRLTGGALVIVAGLARNGR